MTIPHKPRLQRLKHVFVRTPLYLITLCTHERRYVLANETLHEAFRAFCVAGNTRGLVVGRYVLMPDHVHFFLATAINGPALSLYIKSLKNSLSKTLRGMSYPAPHWQKGFFDHVMRSADSFSQKWDYVRANPVRAGLVAQPDEWPDQGVLQDLSFRRS